jgi:hypothetical protein
MPALIRTAVCLLSYALAYSAFAATLDRSAEPSGKYLKEWLLCGPFPALAEAEKNIDAYRSPGMYTDFLQGLGGEGNISPAVGQVVTFLGGSCRWRSYVSPDNAIDLDAAITNTDRVVAYAYCTIDSPKQQACILALGSNDGIRVWLNGEPVLDCPGPPPRTANGPQH